MTRHAALHDPLTGLPNRTLALDRLAHALARRQRERIDVAVFVLDLDGFKTINDSLGHAAGDEVLLALAPRLTAAVRDDRHRRAPGRRRVRRHLPRRRRGRAASTEVAERLAAARQPARWSSTAASTSSRSASAARSAATRERHARSRCSATPTPRCTAPRSAAAAATSCSTRRCAPAPMARVRTEAELRRALDRGELEVYYQPVIDLATGRPVSTEALVRWEHPERGLVSPLEFIPIAEETGLIAELGLQVLEQACRQTAAWQQRASTRRSACRSTSPGARRSTPCSRRRWRRSPSAAGCAPARWRWRSPRPC